VVALDVAQAVQAIFDGLARGLRYPQKRGLDFPLGQVSNLDGPSHRGLIHRKFKVSARAVVAVVESVMVGADLLDVKVLHDCLLLNFRSWEGLRPPDYSR